MNRIELFDDHFQNYKKYGIPLTEKEHAENVAMWKRFEPEKKLRKSPAKKEKHDRKNSVRKNA